MTYKTYTERIVKVPPVVLGLQMQPLSLGHMMLLKSAESAFYTGQYPATDADLLIELVLGAYICSGDDYDATLAGFTNGEFTKFLVEYSKELQQQVEQASRFDYGEEVFKFIRYFNQGQEVPLAYPPEGNGDSTFVDIEEAIKATLMSDCGYTRKEVLNAPLVETMSAYLVHGHRMGAFELMSKEDLELRELLKKQTVERESQKE